ncbi:MAG: zinc metalloprotease HtpX [Acidobacteriota bacterium]|nr:MAG: zinc metalloprotease HtpX [Acidobacteriota bacterium]
MANSVKTVGLLAALTALVVLAGQLLSGTRGAVIALVIAAVMNFGAYWFSDKLVLMRYRARQVQPGTRPRLEGIIDRLVARAGLPRPKLFVIPEAQPNAFATGRNPRHAAVAVTQGLLELMDDEELEGVVAHELAHVKHRDILIGSIAATMAGAVMVLASMARWGALLGGYERDRRDGGLLGLLAVAIVAPLAATMVQLAVSRSREFAADEGAARMAGHPHGLARALRKLGQLSGRIPMEASPASAHMFIVSPLSAREAFTRFFSTHPPLEERIRRLLGRMSR